MVSTGKMSKLAISRNFEISTAGIAGSFTLSIGIKAMTCCASTRDQSWLREANRNRFSTKFPVITVLAVEPVAVMTSLTVS